MLISGGLDGSLCVWDPRKGSCLAELVLAEQLKAAPLHGSGTGGNVPVLQDPGNFILRLGSHIALLNS